MKELGSRSCGKIAVVGGGTAGSLAAASVSRLHPERDHELHHIYDSRIPIIGVGEGSWPSLVRELQQLSQLPHETVQQRLNGTRKFGSRFEGWGRRRQDFVHYFTPQHVAYAYHLSADLMADLLRASTRARHIDARVTAITKVDGGAQVQFEGREPSATIWSSMPAAIRGNWTRRSTSTFPSSPRTAPPFAAAPRSSRRRRTRRSANPRIPVRWRVRTDGCSSFR